MIKDSEHDFGHDKEADSRTLVDSSILVKRSLGPWVESCETPVYFVDLRARSGLNRGRFLVLLMQTIPQSLPASIPDYISSHISKGYGKGRTVRQMIPFLLRRGRCWLKRIWGRELGADTGQEIEASAILRQEYSETSVMCAAFTAARCAVGCLTGSHPGTAWFARSKNSVALGDNEIVIRLLVLREDDPPDLLLTPPEQLLGQGNPRQGGECAHAQHKYKNPHFASCKSINKIEKIQRTSTIMVPSLTSKPYQEGLKAAVSGAAQPAQPRSTPTHPSTHGQASPVSPPHTRGYNHGKMIRRLLPIVVALALALLSARFVRADLPPPEDSYQILFLLPISSISHNIMHMTLATALADRGHKVTMLTNHPPMSRHPNIQEVTHGLEEGNEKKWDFFLIRKDPKIFFQFGHTLAAMTRKLYEVPAIRGLYDRRHTFDLIIVESYFSDMAYPFLHEMPFVALAGVGMEEMNSAVLGNVPHPAYFPHRDFPHQPPFSAIQRARNLLAHIRFAASFRMWSVLPPVQIEISKQFPKLPPLRDLERNVSLVLFNSHYVHDLSYPVLPSQIPVGGMHCRPSEPLPQDLAKWIEEAKHGVIFFSLGSMIQGRTIPPHALNVFIHTFARLNQRVIWTSDLEIGGLSDNVLVGKWFPQQDVIAHPNVKVFVSHAGLLSTQEALYHATPVVALPINYDQPKLASWIENKGLGVQLEWEDLSVPLLLNTINEVIDNPKYTKNMAAASTIFRDQKETPLERAVWWTEYAIRHPGAPSLRCPAMDLSWIEFLCLDVIFLFHALLFALLWAVKKLLSKFLGGSKKQKKE
ncbi:UDP-glucosyltransferase 2-like [Oratosquilla oratoria]|uniref:UDP-glucosyltransferase 2-like n=1 Tax=Oratosquilla oratoria TaxID=337810 RepID=UPI003F759E5C